MNLWHLRTLFRGRLDNAELILGRNGLRGPFQPEWCCDSLVFWLLVQCCEIFDVHSSFILPVTRVDIAGFGLLRSIFGGRVLWIFGDSQSVAVHLCEGEDRLACEDRGGPCHHHVMSPALCCCAQSLDLVRLPDCPVPTPLLLSCRQILPSTCALNLTKSDTLILFVFCAYPDRNNTQGSVSFVEPKPSTQCFCRPQIRISL